MKQQMIFQVDKVKLEVTNRVNFMPFSGVCLFANAISDGIPSGGIDKPVRFPAEELEKSIQTIKLMGVNCKYPKDMPEAMFSGHDSNHKIGVIESTELIGNEMHISGGLWDSDFEEECSMVKLAKDSLGWSVEVFFGLEDRGEYYDAVDIDFTGVALMWKSGAAFKKTRCAAQEAKNKNKGGKQMEISKEQLQEMLDALYGKFESKVSATEKQMEQLAVAFAEDKAERKAKLETEAAEAKEKAELAAKVAAELAAKEEAEAKTKAELEAKQKEEADKLEAQRKSVSFANRMGKFEGATDKQKAILSDNSLTPSNQFQQLISLREEN